MTQREREPIAVAGVPDFWERLRASKRRCLVLDYDGTLAPFREDRMEAYPLEGISGQIERIRDDDDTYVAIMTGRPLKELLLLLGDLGIAVSASQGTEFYEPGGEVKIIQATPRQAQRLARAEVEAAAVSRGGHVERKLASVAFHTRGLDPGIAKEAETELCEIWDREADQYDLDCRSFNGGVELRLKDIDKGTALHELLRDQPTDAFCVYIGDDDTDEDAFLEIRGRGIGIKVGGADVPTHATGRVSDCEAVREVLRYWVSIVEGA